MQNNIDKFAIVHILECQNEAEKAIRKMIRLSGTGLYCSIEMAGILETWAAIMKSLSFVGMNTEKHVPVHDFLSKSSICTLDLGQMLRS